MLRKFLNTNSTLGLNPNVTTLYMPCGRAVLPLAARGVGAEPWVDGRARIGREILIVAHTISVGKGLKIKYAAAGGPAGVTPVHRAPRGYPGARCGLLPWYAMPRLCPFSWQRFFHCTAKARTHAQDSRTRAARGGQLLGPWR